MNGGEGKSRRIVVGYAREGEKLAPFSSHLYLSISLSSSPGYEGMLGARVSHLVDAPLSVNAAHLKLGERRRLLSARATETGSKLKR